jgi:hypothetical protein
VRRCATFKPLDDDHAAAAAGAEIGRLRLGSIGGIGGIGTHCLDVINGDDWRREQFAGTRDVLGTLTAGEQAMSSIIRCRSVVIALVVIGNSCLE